MLGGGLWFTAHGVFHAYDGFWPTPTVTASDRGFSGALSWAL
jgi:hypothetical protein